MPFIGQQPITGAYHKLDSITTSATATYNLQLNGGAYYPTSANHLLVSLNGVMQAPQDSFTVSGSTITFASALTSSDNIDFIMALGDVLNIGTPSDGTVNTGQLANDAVTTAKITDANITDAKLASTLDLSGKTVTYGLTDSDMPSGSVLQVVQTNMTATASYSGTTFQTITGLTTSITPSSTSSKILIMLNISQGEGSDAFPAYYIKRNGTIVSIADAGSQTETTFAGVRTEASARDQYRVSPVNFQFLDSPSSTSAVSYTVEVSPMRVGSRTVLINQSQTLGDANQLRATSTVILMEIAG